MDQVLTSLKGQVQPGCLEEGERMLRTGSLLPLAPSAPSHSAISLSSYLPDPPPPGPTTSHLLSPSCDSHAGLRPSWNTQGKLPQEQSWALTIPCFSFFCQISAWLTLSSPSHQTSPLPPCLNLQRPLLGPSDPLSFFLSTFHHAGCLALLIIFMQLPPPARKQAS